MQNKSKIALIIIITIVTAGGLSLALKMKNLSSNLESSTNITSSLKTQIDKLQRENEKQVTSLKKQVISHKSQVASLEKDRKDLRVRILDLQKEKAEAKKVSESQSVKVYDTLIL